MSETPLHFKTITELAELIKSKELSPVEVTDAMLDRIRERDLQYKSYATVMAEQARTSAQAAERAISSGNYLGPLHGVPIAVKDLCFTKGVKTMGATKALMNHVPDFDCTVVQKLNAAGIETVERMVSATATELGEVLGISEGAAEALRQDDPPIGYSGTVGGDLTFRTGNVDLVQVGLNARLYRVTESATRLIVGN
ncbi:MAG: hypothetical protein COB68_12995, partial [SAR202 cluster bacterium]